MRKLCSQYISPPDVLASIVGLPSTLVLGTKSTWYQVLLVLGTKVPSSLLPEQVTFHLHWLDWHGPRHSCLPTKSRPSQGKRKLRAASPKGKQEFSFVFFISNKYIQVTGITFVYVVVKN